MARRNNSRSGSILYLLIHIPLFFIWKIGITGVGVFKRAKGVSDDAPGWFVPIFAVWLPGAYYLEQWLHSVFAPLNVVFYKGSGCTETFWFPAGLLTLPIMLGIWGLYCAGIDAVFGTNTLDIFLTALGFCWHYLLWAVLKTFD